MSADMARRRGDQPATSPGASSPGALPWVALVAVYVLWGSTYLAIRVAVESLPPLLLAGARFTLAGALLYPLAVRRSGMQPSPRQWAAGAVVGVLLLATGNGAVVWAEQAVPSGLAALLVATVPMWMVLFDWVMDREKRPSATIVVGIGVALVGVWMLTQGTETAAFGVWPVMVVLLGSVSWAAGSIWSRTARQARDPLVAAAVQMITGGTVLGVASMASGELARLDLAGATPASFAAFLWLVGGGSLLGFTAYVYALQTLPTPTVATYAFVNPVVAVGLGWLLLGEELDGAGLIGGMLVVASVALIVRRRSKIPTSVGPTTEGDGPADDLGDRRALSGSRPTLSTAAGSSAKTLDVPSGRSVRALPARPPDGGYLLRPARPADLESIERLLARVGLQGGVSDHLASTVVIRDRGDVVGSGTLELEAEDALLRSVAVDPEQQGTGIGTILVRSLVLGATRNGVARVWLFTEAADEWFSRFGFQAVPRSSVPCGLFAADERRRACRQAAVPMVLELPRRTAAA